MMKKTLLLLALTVSALGVAEGSFAGETGFTATTGGKNVTEALAVGICEAKEKEWSGLVSGQFLYEIQADLTKGRQSTVKPASSVVRDGFITGTGGSPRETQDGTMLLIPESKGKQAWDGFLPGSFCYWQCKP